MKNNYSTTNKKVIFHIDMNNFYASVECMLNMKLRNKPVAVGGDVENRHGIILAKNNIAKKYGVPYTDILKANGMSLRDASRIRPGKRLVIPAPAKKSGR